MEITNNNRFIVKKNAYEYLKSLDASDAIINNIGKISLCSSSEYEYKYSWDIEFRKNFSWNFEKVDEIIKYYPDAWLFLKNIYWDKIFINAEKVLDEVINSLSNYKDKSLFIISMNSLEMMIVWEMLKNSWINNLVYSLIRQPTINSYSKTFEALLLMVSFDKSLYFQQLAKPLIDKVKVKISSIKSDDTYIIMDENNSYHRFNFLNISSYLKTQIWMSEDKITYRIDKYPKKDFIESKWIKNIVILDNDNDVWKSIQYYTDTIKTEIPSIKISNVSYEIDEIKEIWYYEDYLLAQNIKYNEYITNIEKVVSNKKQINQKQEKTQTSKADPYVYRNQSKQYSEVNHRIVPFLIIFPILVIAFLVSDLSSWTSNSSWTWTTSWYHSNTYFFSNYWHSSSSYFWGSSSSSKWSSSSFVRSFGWWWFSKWFS